MRLPYLLVLALAACSPTDSAVRSEIWSEGSLPRTRVYPGEEISITLWNLRSDSPDQVSILIEPNGTLYVRRYEVDWLENPPRINAQTLDSKQMNEDLLGELRNRLSAYRPAALSKAGPTVFPKGCSLIMHGRSVISVSFRGTHEQSGSFVFQEGCVGPSAAKIETDLKEIMSMLPALNGTAGYGWSET